MIYLDDLRNATGGQLFGEVAAREFTSFCHDPDFVQAGQLYVALQIDGEDGHHQIARAIEQGASGVLCQTPPLTTISGVTVVVVGDTVAALSQWMAYVLRQYGTMVIAVTGVAGTSITAASIATILRLDYEVYYSPPILAGSEGLAISLGGLDKRHQIVVVELTARKEGEMASLLAVTQPSIAVVTQISSRLTSNNEVIERNLAEAQEVIRALPQQGMAIVNYDDPQARLLTTNAPSTVLSISTSGNESGSADLIALNVEYFVDKVGFDLKNGMQRLRGYWTPALGEPGLQAALNALAVGMLFEVPVQRALDALKSMPPLPGHLTLLDGINRTFLIDDSANATVMSVVTALNLLQALKGQSGHRFVILGDLSSTSEDLSDAYDEIGRQIASVADYLITIGDSVLDVVKSVVRSGMPSNRITPLYRHADAVSVMHGLVQADDVVLLTGGQQVQMGRIAAGLLARAEDSVWLPNVYSQRHTYPATSSWIELDLDALAQNLRDIKARVGSKVKLMVMVTANAYGHGLVPIASTALQNGADLLAVADVGEALLLRRLGIHEPILVTGVVPFGQLSDAIRHNLAISIWDHEGARSAARAASDLQKQVRVHIRVDTGFGDYGLHASEVAALVRELVKLDDIIIDGLYTDFAAADTLVEAAATHDQLDRFKSVFTSLKATGISIPYIHAANSAAILTLPPSYFTTVRAGSIIYGLHPSVDVPAPAGLQRVLSWKTAIGQVKTIAAGTAIGYGNTYRSDQEMRIAVLPVGYADGFRSGPRNWGEVLVGGKRARLVGQVGMDRCVIDITGIANVAVGQEVVLIGTQGRERITVEDVARRLDCTNYEVVATLSSQIARIPSWRVE